MAKIDIESQLRIRNSHPLEPSRFWANLLEGDVQSIGICVVVFLVVFAGGIVIFSSSGSEQTSQSLEQERHQKHQRFVDAIASIDLEDSIPTDVTAHSHATFTFFFPKPKSDSVSFGDLSEEFVFELRQCDVDMTDASECVSTDPVHDQFEDIILGFKLEEDAIKFDHFRVVFAIRQKNAPSTATPRFSKFSSWFHRDGDASESKLSTNSVSHPALSRETPHTVLQISFLHTNSAPLTHIL
eukprot:1000213_1